jgi:hypothetical protein
MEEHLMINKILILKQTFNLMITQIINLIQIIKKIQIKMIITINKMILILKNKNKISFVIYLFNSILILFNIDIKWYLF